MTRRLNLPEHFPEALHRAHPLISSVGRITILDYMLHNPGRTRTEIVEALEVAGNLVDEALIHLRAGGYLPPSTGRGKPQPLVIDRERLATDLASVVTTLLA